MAHPIGAPAFAAPQKGVQAEKNPPGDIPDDQVFVAYRSPLGFTLQVPEGWARADRPDGVRFSDKYNIIDTTVAKTDPTPTAEPAALRQVAADLVSSGATIKIASVKEVKLKGGSAVRIAYTSNSERNPVTNKHIRLEHARYILFKDGKAATVDFAAPEGADNADQWQLMSNSFRWD